MILHSLDPWLIARHVPNLERTARTSLARAGFECWYPNYREYRPLPLAKIPPRKRHLAVWYVREVVRPRFPGYLLIRPLPFCKYDVNDLAELRGCGRIVSVGGRTAKIQDFDVELMRLAEARGVFDVHIGVGRRRYSITPAKEAWQGRMQAKCLQFGEVPLFIDALGRIARIIAHDQENESGFAAQSVP